MIDHLDAWFTLLPLAWVLTSRQLSVGGRDITLPTLVVLLPGPLSLAYAHHPSGWAIYAAYFLACVIVSPSLPGAWLKPGLVMVSATLLYFSRYEARLAVGGTVIVFVVFKVSPHLRRHLAAREGRGRYVVFMAVLLVSLVGLVATDRETEYFVVSGLNNLRSKSLSELTAFFSPPHDDLVQQPQHSLPGVRRIFAMQVRDVGDCGDLGARPFFLVVNDVSACGGLSVVPLSDQTSYPMRLDRMSRPAATAIGALALLAIAGGIGRAFAASWRRNVGLALVVLLQCFLAYVAGGATSGALRYVMPSGIALAVLSAPPLRRNASTPWWASWAGAVVGSYFALVVISRLLT